MKPCPLVTWMGNVHGEKTAVTSLSSPLHPDHTLRILLPPFLWTLAPLLLSWTRAWGAEHMHFRKEGAEEKESCDAW